MSPQKRKAVIYARLSLDRDKNKPSIETQIENCRNYAESQGWEVVAATSDRDVSGSKRNVAQPGLDEALGYIRRGEANVLVAWKIDRLSRQGVFGKFGHLWEEIVEELGGDFAFTDGMSTMVPGSRLALVNMAEVGRMEARNISDRVKAAREREARQGKAPAAGSRPFGYSGVKLEVVEGQEKRVRVIIPDGYSEPNQVVEAEASLIHEAVDRIFAGESVTKIAEDWNSRGIRTTTGKLWSTSGLIQVLRGPRIRGVRVHHGVESEGDWPAIISPEIWEKLREVLDNPSRRFRRYGNVVQLPKSHLLTGLSYCGGCGNRLEYGGTHYYQCVKKTQRPNACRAVAISGPSLEKYVLGQAILHYVATGLPEPADSGESLKAEIAGLEQSRADLEHERYVTRKLPADRYLQYAEEIDAQLANLRQQLETVDKGPHLPEAEFLAEIQKMASEEERQRQFVLAMVERIDVDKLAEKTENVRHRTRQHNGNRFDTSRVHIRFRKDEAEPSNSLENLVKVARAAELLGAEELLPDAMAFMIKGIELGQKEGKVK